MSLGRGNSSGGGQPPALPDIRNSTVYLDEQCPWICPWFGCGLRCGGVKNHMKNDPEHSYHQCPVHFGRRCPKCDHEAVFMRGHFLCMRCGWKHP